MNCKDWPVLKNESISGKIIAKIPGHKPEGGEMEVISGVILLRFSMESLLMAPGCETGTLAGTLSQYLGDLDGDAGLTGNILTSLLKFESSAVTSWTGLPGDSRRLCWICWYASFWVGTGIGSLFRVTAEPELGELVTGRSVGRGGRESLEGGE